MVHALNEIHRVLVGGSILIDLRPFADQSPVEVVSGRQTHLAGRLDQLPEDIANDEAANQAIAKAAEQGWFTLERKQFFPFSSSGICLKKCRHISKMNGQTSLAFPKIYGEMSARCGLWQMLMLFYAYDGRC